MIQWQRPKLDGGDRQYLEVVAGLRPSFLCIDGGELRNLLKDYFFRRKYYRDPLMVRFETRLGKRLLSVENTEEAAEFIAVTRLLGEVCKLAPVEEKKNGSEYVALFDDMAIFRKAREGDFNDWKFLLAFLAKRAWNLRMAEAEDFMKNLDSVAFKAVYW